jgi:arylsulfatase A-like enzyme
MNNNSPNIIFFMVDQMSAKWLEVAISGACEMPNIEKMIKNSMNFTNAFSSNPVCCPARATIATGMTSRGHGVLENGYYLDPSLSTFMKDLQKNGWKTGAFGKLHFESHYMGPYNDYKKYGFDITHITEDPRAGEWLDWVKEEHPQYYKAALATAWPLYADGFNQYGDEKIDICSEIIKAKKEVEFATKEFPKNSDEAYTLPFPEEISQSAWITKHAVNFIETTDINTPIFAQISYVSPHSPYCPPGDYMKYVDIEKIPEPVEAEWLKDENAPKYFERQKPSNRDWLYNRQCYLADIRFLDKQLGLIMRALEKSKRLKNSYIIFLSDHGDMLGDHGFYLKEERHYDACIRVPLIIYGPDIKGNVECKEIVQSEDICPTVYDIAGIKPKKPPIRGTFLVNRSEEFEPFSGKTLLDLCRGNAKEWRKVAYVESYNAIWSTNVGDWARTVRTKRYRYTYYANNNGEQLFDLANDPDETHNLIGNKKFSGIHKELKDELFEKIIMQDYPKTQRQLFAFGVH